MSCWIHRKGSPTQAKTRNQGKLASMDSREKFSGEWADDSPMCALVSGRVQSKPTLTVPFLLFYHFGNVRTNVLV